ncbi:hypothetical protein BVC80_9063g98 [Macleaya cordata]|uniref:Uncharacterized protein n=1 Tax=Macleaya cordata TaxID=56857 RepID=A0A200PND6_MACCD|nr:hypothetical protein BVC80_9063g98 [Macleaya cordata]
MEGQSSASLKKCYNDCLLLCIIQHPGPDAAVICPFKCEEEVQGCLNSCSNKCAKQY